MIEPGTTADATALTMDWFPTLIEAAGGEVPAGLDGVSPAADPAGRTGRDPTGPPPALHPAERAARINGPGRRATRSFQAAGSSCRTGRSTRLELFHLAEDPGETTDLIREEPARAKELGRLLTDFTRQTGAVPWAAPAIAE